MPYIRISLMRPLAGKEAAVVDLNSQLVTFYREQEGCRQSHLIKATDGSSEVGRVSLWQSEATADRAATLDRSMALRSRLHLLVRRGHQERSFLAE